MLDHQSMTRAASGGGEHHGLADQRPRLDQIEDMLEQPGIGALVHGRADNQRIGLLDGIDDAGRRKGQILALQSRAKAWAGIDQIEDVEAHLSVARATSARPLDESCVSWTGDGGCRTSRRCEADSWHKFSFRRLEAQR